jgi:hypothetical protein
LLAIQWESNLEEMKEVELGQSKVAVTAAVKGLE